VIGPYLPPDRIVGLFYDIVEDDFVFVRADGSEYREPHSPYLNGLASEYYGWYQAMNGYSGVYAATYSRAVDVFAGKV